MPPSRPTGSSSCWRCSTRHPNRRSKRPEDGVVVGPHGGGVEHPANVAHIPHPATSGPSTPFPDGIPRLSESSLSYSRAHDPGDRDGCGRRPCRSRSDARRSSPPPFRSSSSRGRRSPPARSRRRPASPKAPSSASSRTRPRCSTRSSRLRSTLRPPRPPSAAIDPTLSFEDRLIAAVEILRQRVLYVFNVLSVASGTTRGATQQRSTELPALTAIFESEAEQLSRAPADAARVLRGLTFACVHPAFGTDEPLTSEDIVAVLLDGIRRPAPRSRRADPADPRLPGAVPQVADPRPRSSRRSSRWRR